MRQYLLDHPNLLLALFAMLLTGLVYGAEYLFSIPWVATVGGYMAYGIGGLIAFGFVGGIIWVLTDISVKVWPLTAFAVLIGAICGGVEGAIIGFFVPGVFCLIVANN